MKIALKLFAVLALITLYAYSCKTTDKYTVTEDGWHIHSNVPIDSTLR